MAVMSLVQATLFAFVVENVFGNIPNTDTDQFKAFQNKYAKFLDDHTDKDGNVLSHTLENYLRTLHPFSPQPVDGKPVIVADETYIRDILVSAGQPKECTRELDLEQSYLRYLWPNKITIVKTKYQAYRPEFIQQVNQQIFDYALTLYERKLYEKIKVYKLVVANVNADKSTEIFVEIYSDEKLKKFTNPHRNVNESTSAAQRK